MNLNLKLMIWIHYTMHKVGWPLYMPKHISFYEFVIEGTTLIVELQSNITTVWLKFMVVLYHLPFLPMGYYF